MKVLSTLMFLMFALNCYSQNQQFNKQIFTDSIMSVIFKTLEIERPKTYYLLSRTDIWQHNRFYFKPPDPGQHVEEINLYAYNDNILMQLINPKQWSYLAHTALTLFSKRIKNFQTNVSIIKDVSKSNEDIFFSITQPVVFKMLAIVDMTYYVRDKELISFEQWYKGQALFVFQKQFNNNWQLTRIVNRVIP